MSLFWMLVLGAWAGLIILILHDATKDDGDGGAVRVAAKAFGIAIDRSRRKIRRLGRALRHAIPRKAVSAPPAKMPAAVGDALPSSHPIQQPPLTEPAYAVAPKRKPWRKEGRVTCTIAELELNITEAVQKAAPECEGFLGVILKKTTPRSRRDANWQVQGVKFGKADRKIAGEALTTIIERMRKDVSIAEG
ncbi:MAG TPA: hypothetical protein VGM09_12010 [Bradyrhizobium sp.]|jgi:hypothetical protein